MSRSTAVSLSFLSLAILAIMVVAVPARGDLSLVWSDEFDGDSLDPANWTIDIGDGCPDLCGWGNNELEYYRAENVSVADGNLVLTAKDEYFNGRYFTSGKVHTRDKQYFLYGRMEMRAKIPTGGGMWPAFWMMPQFDFYGGWASSGEIDIMESANATDFIGGTLHFGGSWPENASTGGTYAPGGVNFADDYHVYAVEWEPEQIRWYVDEVLYSTKFNWQWYSAGDPANPLAPFDEEFYLLLNTAVGGDYTGCISPGCITADLPQEYFIDYVRVYQETSNLAPTVTILSPTPGDNPPAGDITITAGAEDADGYVTRVEFYHDTTYLGEDLTAPYSFTWNVPVDGCYSIVVKAIDDVGAFGTDSADLTVGGGCGQAPYQGGPFVLPATIEGEDYDLGGEGVAYHDTDFGNNGNAYRSDDVDVQVCTDLGGGYNLGWIIAGEWLEYTVEVPETGDYPIDVRVASQYNGGSFRIEFNGMDKTGLVYVPVTGGWQTWTTVSTTANLAAGSYVMRFIPVDEGYNLNYFDIQEPTAVDPGGTPVASSALHPCYPNPFNPTTAIRYELSEPSRVHLKVYDVAGKLVKRLLAGEIRDAGRYEVVWNGRDESDRAVGSGVYLYRLDAGGFTQTRRMTLVK